NCSTTRAKNPSWNWANCNSTLPNACKLLRAWGRYSRPQSAKISHHLPDLLCPNFLRGIVRNSKFPMYLRNIEKKGLLMLNDIIWDFS
ncbi:MAG TPA: hypothetical protein VNW27_00135, partial [Candidatus Bathyarchaeia archaeon]|nr:hypothetical protein [Candidatus Bathyarchaeia archaeon]